MVRKATETPMQTIAIALNFLPEVDGKTLLLKTAHKRAKQHNSAKLELDCKFLSCLPCFTDAIQTVGRENALIVSLSVDPAYYNTELPIKMFALFNNGMNVIGITSGFVIAFKVNSIGVNSCLVLHTWLKAHDCGSHRHGE